MQLKSAVPSATDRCCAENEKLFFAEKGEWGTPLEKGKCLYFSKVHKNMYISVHRKATQPKNGNCGKRIFLQKKLFVKNIDEQEIL